MKFLMRMEGRQIQMPPEQTIAILQASKEHTMARLTDGRFDCAYGFPEGDGFCVANYDSHEALMDDLLTYPQYPLMDWVITPLVGAEHSYDRFIEYLKKQVG